MRRPVVLRERVRERQVLAAATADRRRLWWRHKVMQRLRDRDLEADVLDLHRLQIERDLAPPAFLAGPE